MSKALLIIDLQNDYFPGGNYPLWNTDEVLANVERAASAALEKDVPVILVQHVADENKGISPFFNAGTEGVEVHPRLRAAAPDARVVVKSKERRTRSTMR